ncbi:uncharacterized protein C8R40DRAFT_850304 [Lentinula edodes]|uniref:uncharacterized protein n=1 Tax=Lentinula edodes TaxID=5353 RepID=UPI001E8EC486|nr:uncharacterized protein C8R40DRAFT_850304 [Lentinula edodes]KAH7868286.1 hypothetical protein C8R40DRAFT_850304 [Lentinula edodes]
MVVHNYKQSRTIYRRPIHFSFTITGTIKHILVKKFHMGPKAEEYRVYPVSIPVRLGFVVWLRRVSPKQAHSLDPLAHRELMNPRTIYSTFITFFRKIPFPFSKPMPG